MCRRKSRFIAFPNQGVSRLRQAGLDRKDRHKRADVAAAIVILESYLRRSR